MVDDVQQDNIKLESWIYEGEVFSIVAFTKNGTPSSYNSYFGGRKQSGQLGCCSRSFYHLDIIEFNDVLIFYTLPTEVY